MTKTTVSFNSVKFAISLEKSMNKGTISLVHDFMSDIKKSDSETVKKALKDALKKEGLTPSNAFTMKVLNSSVALVNAGISSEESASVIAFCKVKPSEGEKMTARKLAESIEKAGNLAELIKQAKDAQKPDAKKAKRKESAKQGAKTRLTNKKGEIVPNAVRQANMQADSCKEEPTQKATPAMKIDRAVNCFLALTDDERIAFYNAVRRELNDVVLTVSKAKTKMEKAS